MGLQRDDADLDALAALPGFGRRTAPWLAAIGIRTPQDLGRRLEREDGALEAYLELRASRPGVNLNALWVLEALNLGCDWRQVPAQRKADLRARAAAAGT